MSTRVSKAFSMQSTEQALLRYNHPHARRAYSERKQEMISNTGNLRKLERIVKSKY